MSTTFPLPLECLQIIIHHLAQHRSTTHVLARLLCVNRYICNATLPILYENPFKIVARLGEESKNPRAAKALERLAMNLLLSFPNDGNNTDNGDYKPPLTDLLRAAFLPESQYPPLLPFIPYYAYVSVVDFGKLLRSTEITTLDPSSMGHPAYINHLNQDHVLASLAAAQPTGRLRSGAMVYRVQAARVELRKDFIWALCANNAENIQTLDVPLSEISRYHSLVKRFRILSTVTFYMDYVIQYEENRRSAFTPQDLESLAQRQKERSLHLEEMIRFVQELRQYHPQVLKVANCPTPGTSGDKCPEEYQFRLLQCLPPLNNPLNIDSSNWAQFISKAQETDLSHVLWISLDAQLSGVNYLERINLQGHFLHRCRSLLSVKFNSWSEDLFQWAADERRGFITESAAGRNPKAPLVRLERASINYPPSSRGRQVNDIMFGFGETLRSLEVASHLLQLNFASLTPQNLPEFTVGGHDGDGRYCELPQLSRFTLITRNHFLRIDPLLLCRIPAILCLVLRDPRSVYSIEDIEYWSPPVTSLLQLSHINLEGTPAISFHPDTLRNTPNLKHLQLGIVSGRFDMYIPPVQDLQDVEQQGDGYAPGTGPATSTTTPASMPQITRPVWTWDWELLKLKNLILNSAFAYKFQFRMLEKTPNLMQLSLDMKTLERQHQRMIQVDDLPRNSRASMTVMTTAAITPTTTTTTTTTLLQGHNGQTVQPEQLSDRDFSNNANEYVQLRLLESLSIQGDWILSEAVLSILFRDIAPNITYLVLTGGCRGFRPECLIETTSRNLQKLAMTLTSLPDEPARLEAAGLVRAVTRGGLDTCYHLAKWPEGRDRKALPYPAKYVFGCQ